MPTHHAPLGTDQAKYRNQLAQAVEAINEVDDLLKTNTSSDLASNRATALALSAIARVLILESGEKSNLLGRLPAFKYPK